MRYLTMRFVVRYILIGNPYVEFLRPTNTINHMIDFSYKYIEISISRDLFVRRSKKVSELYKLSSSFKVFTDLM